MDGLDYKRFFDLSLEMLSVINSEGYFVEVNDSLARVLGYSKSHLLSEPFVTYLHPEDVSRTQDAIEKILKGAVQLNFSNRIKHREGHYLVFSWSSKVDEKTGLVFSVGSDITERRKREEKSVQVEQALRSGTILVETDQRGVIVSVNEKFCEISGYSKHELVGNTHKIVNSGVHPQSFFADMWKTISSKKVWSGVLTNKNKNGNFYTVQTIITPIFDDKGHISSYLAIRQDITDSIRHQTELTRTLSILKETSSIAKVGGWELEIETGELNWTDETFRILEVEKNENQKPMLLEGLELFVSEHQAIVEVAVNNAIEFGEPYSLELEAQTAKGNVLWVYTTGRANYQDGKVVSLTGTIQDIDERKQAEFKYNLERQKSIQSAKLASLGELAASITHEINNPLSVISGYAELLLGSEGLPKSATSNLDLILKSCDRIEYIVNNTKKFSRTAVSSDRAPHSLSLVINEAIALARPRLELESVEITLIESEYSEISCNLIEIEQVILNLINNAIDALKDSAEKWIRISLVEMEETIECYVVDSGLGVPKSIQANIFTPFYTSKKPGEGTGLGLSIVKDILNNHGAVIEYDNTSPSTCFVLEFPKVGVN